jgi:hypothetical protein
MNPNWCLHISAPVTIITDPLLLRQGRQFRFPRSGKSRIRNKWAKKEENYKREPDTNFYQINGVWHCHPSLKKVLHYELYKQGKMMCPPIFMTDY